MGVDSGWPEMYKGDEFISRMRVQPCFLFWELWTKAVII